MILSSSAFACLFCSLIAATTQSSQAVRSVVEPEATVARFELQKGSEELSVLSIRQCGSEVRVRRLSFWLKELNSRRESCELEYTVLGSTGKRTALVENILVLPEAETFWIEVAEVAEDKIVGSVHVEEKHCSQIRVSQGDTGHWISGRSSTGEVIQIDPRILGIPLRQSSRKIVAGVTPPRVLSTSTPSYTDSAIEANAVGVIILQCMIGENGRADPFSFSVVRGLGYGLDEAGIEAVANQWRFQPATMKGEPVDVQATLEVVFHLKSRP